ncbi:MAG: hypothetical protein E7146_07150 [Rikenellaceae bacterium]|nr:hypothetical protein [Rikenellaceae bacterium]
MKKILFFAAMLSFAVACGGNQQNNAEEAVEATDVAVESTEVVVAPAPQTETENTEQKEVFNGQKLEANVDTQLQVVEAKEGSEMKLSVSEVKEVEEPKKGLKVEDSKKNKLSTKEGLQVSGKKTTVGTAEAAK